jgi:hypothetical protein
LNSFRKLIVHKVLRPDSYVIVLDDYVNSSLELEANEPDWSFIFKNTLYKSIVINMSSESNITNMSSMSRIHKNLFQIAKQSDCSISALNCSSLTLNELSVAVKNAKEDLILLKSLHLASSDIIEFVAKICDWLNSKLVYFWSNCSSCFKNYANFNLKYFFFL